MRTGTRESPSWPGLDPETGYVDADCSDQIAETSCRRGGPYVFKSDRRVGVLRMMAGSGRELAVAHLVQNPAQGRFRGRDPELLPDPLDQIDQPPAHDTMDGRNRSRFDQLAKGASMLVLEQGRLAGCLPVEQSGRPVGVKPDDPVPDD